MRSSFVIVVALLVAAGVSAQQLRTEFNGNSKTRLIGQAFPEDSIFHDLTGRTALDLATALRLSMRADRGRWSADAAYQLILQYGDSAEYSRVLQATTGLNFDQRPTDERRLLNLTRSIRDAGKFAALHRLDRLSVGFATEKTVVRLGRQAITWGNGMYFTPMDIVNPFDTTTIDTEYKTGDDMLYVQYLTANGHDIQGAMAFRRDAISGKAAYGEYTSAVKYHGVLPVSEYDLLLAQTYGDWLLGVGGNRSIGGSVLRGDLLLTDSDTGIKAQLVGNLGYSWVWRKGNLTGVLEYYFNGFGQAGGQYDAASLAGNPQLLRRLARAQSFTLGRHYLAGGVSIEVTPLWVLSPTLFLNLGDGSALLQLSTQNSLGDNLTFLAALRVPVGPDGSEYGGIESGMPNRYLSIDAGVFAQLAWYF
jgi:hypothetical protein